MGSGPRGILLSKKNLALISSCLSLFESPPNCFEPHQFDEGLGACLVISLPGKKRPKVVNGFGPMELEKCLAMPTSRLLGRFDFRSFLDLLMKLRTVLHQEWLETIPVLHKVPHFPRFATTRKIRFVNIISFLFFPVCVAIVLQSRNIACHQLG